MVTILVNKYLIVLFSFLIMIKCHVKIDESKTNNHTLKIDSTRYVVFKYDSSYHWLIQNAARPTTLSLSEIFEVEEILLICMSLL